MASSYTRPRYVSPLDAGSYTVGRTDEGVDFGLQAGAAIRAIGAGVVDFVGRFRGFGPYIAYHLTQGRYAGEEIYSAENQTIVVRRGQRLRPGQVIARARGGGIEMGLAEAGGSYLPVAHRSYREGDVTPAGRRFRGMLAHLGAGSQGLGFPELQQLWVRAGGPKAIAPIMAAIALAESGGNPGAHALTRQEDSRGLWQVNVRAHPRFSHANLYDPAVNAQAAVAVYRSQGLGAWSTYSSGAYASYLEGTAGPSFDGRTRPGGPDDGEAQLADWYNYLDPPGFPGSGYNKWFNDAGNALDRDIKHALGLDKVEDFLKLLVWLADPRTWLRAIEFLTGMGLIVLGLVAILLNFLSKEELPPGTGPAVRATRSLRRGARRTAPVRAIRGGRARRQGAAQQRETEESDRLRRERERGRKRQRARSTNRRLRREGRRTQSGDIPF
jgi:Lysozyme like domain/Peptidase family M23